MTTPSERERAEYWLNSTITPAFFAQVSDELPPDLRVHKRSIVVMMLAEYAEAARREELDRTREYLRKLAWSDADILAWENWHGK